MKEPTTYHCVSRITIARKGRLWAWQVEESIWREEPQIAGSGRAFTRRGAVRAAMRRAVFFAAHRVEANVHYEWTYTPTKSEQHDRVVEPRLVA
jgi:hypothetical protein